MSGNAWACQALKVLKWDFSWKYVLVFLYLPVNEGRTSKERLKIAHNSKRARKERFQNLNANKKKGKRCWKAGKVYRGIGDDPARR